MSEVVKFSINGDTNADQVTDKVKKSVSQLEKNMEGIQNRFKSFGKDLFLSFAAPMVLLNSAINMVSASIEKARQETRDAIADAEKGENKYMRAGTVTSAREVAARRQDALDRKNAKLAAEALAEEQGAQGGVLGFGGEADKALLQYTGEGEGVMGKIGRGANAALMFLGINSIAKNEEMQKVLERRAGERVAADPTAQAAAKQKEAAEAQIAAQKEVDKMPTSFKGPDGGFSNVVGVGANPVIEAMTAQLEEAKKTNELLAQLVTPNAGRTDGWIANPTASPSRAAMLQGK
jgi:hypothetical protein